MRVRLRDIRNRCVDKIAPAHLQRDSGGTASLAPIDWRNCEYRRARMKRYMIMTNGKEPGGGESSLPSAPAGCMMHATFRTVYAFAKSDTARHSSKSRGQSHTPRLHSYIVQSSLQVQLAANAQLNETHSRTPQNHNTIRTCGSWAKYHGTA
jgi:hypothetical protein